MRLRFLRRLCVAALVLAAGCSPTRLNEAVKVLADIDAGWGPSALKAETAAPQRRPVSYTIDGRARRGDLYAPVEPARAAMVLVPGVAHQGKDDPRLVAFANTLTRARFEVLVPNLGGLRDLKVSAEDIHAIADASLYLARLDDGRRPLGVTAISYAAGPAVAALFEPGVEEGVDFALAIGGYHDLEAVLTFFTTGYYREARRAWHHRSPNAYGKWMFVRSNAGRLESRRDRVLLSAMAGRKLDDLSADVSDLAADLGAEGRAVWALLENRDPDRVPALIAALSPGVVEDIRRLDLKRRDLARLGVRFILVHGRDDSIIPETESMGLGAALAPGRAELFILDSLDHVDPKPTGLADKIRLLRAIYWVLELRDGVGNP